MEVEVVWQDNLRATIRNKEIRINVDSEAEIVVTYVLAANKIGFQRPTRRELLVIENMIAIGELVASDKVHYYADIKQELMQYDCFIDVKKRVLI